MQRTSYPPACWEGVDSASDGEPITANPYAADDLDDPAAYARWRRGWMDWRE